MDRTLEGVLQAAASYASYASYFGEKSAPSPSPPLGNGIAILTCQEGYGDGAGDGTGWAAAREQGPQVFLVRVVDGVDEPPRPVRLEKRREATPALVISYKARGKRDWFNIHGGDSGLDPFPEKIIGDLVTSDLRPPILEVEPRQGPAPRPAPFQKDAAADSGAIRDQANRLTADLEWMRLHPLVPRELPIRGCLYLAKSRRLVELPRSAADRRLGAPGGVFAAGDAGSPEPS